VWARVFCCAYMQVMGKLWEDEELLAVTRCLQDLLPPLPPPSIFAS
jgi:hypothetical protein